MKSRTLHRLGLAAALALLAGCASTSAPVVAETPGCLSNVAVDRLLADYNARRPAANPPETLTMADAHCSRSKLQQRLAGQAGRLVGYKAGLTNPAVQKRFNTDKPVWGRLYKGALLANRTTVPAAFGARPLFEADMVVRVSSSAINRATTPAQVLANVDRIVPYIELPDLMVEDPKALNGATVEAINVGSRLGVLGDSIRIPQYRDERYRLIDALQSMEIVIKDQTGTKLGGGRGGDLMAQPLNAVIWLVQALDKEGRSLKVGDWVSLGSFSALVPPKAGQHITIEYNGLPGAQPVEVTFE